MIDKYDGNEAVICQSLLPFPYLSNCISRIQSVWRKQSEELTVGWRKEVLTNSGTTYLQQKLWCTLLISSPTMETSWREFIVRFTLENLLFPKFSSAVQQKLLKTLSCYIPIFQSYFECRIYTCKAFSQSSLTTLTAAKTLSTSSTKIAGRPHLMHSLSSKPSFVLQRGLL